MAKAKKQALGRGLSALLPERPQFGEAGANEQVAYIAIERLSADPGQPRHNFDADKLAELAESIRQFGVMQPLLVTATMDGDYRIVAGERRLRAAQLAGLGELPCIIRNYQERELAEISLIENIQREDLTALEEAAAYRNLLDSFGYTQEALAERLGKSRPHIANTLRLLRLVPPEVSAISESAISTADEARSVLNAGALGVLIGTSILRAPDTASRVAYLSQALPDALDPIRNPRTISDAHH